LGGSSLDSGHKKNLAANKKGTDHSFWEEPPHRLYTKKRGVFRDGGTRIARGKKGSVKGSTEEKGDVLTSFGKKMSLRNLPKKRSSGAEIDFKQLLAGWGVGPIEEGGQSRAFAPAAKKTPNTEFVTR